MTTTHRQRRTWAVVTPVVFLLAGGLFAVSAANSEGTDLRPGRTTDLAGLVQVENRHLRDLRAESRSLTKQVEALSATKDDLGSHRVRDAVRRLKGPAGLKKVTGEGVTVTLSDAPREVRDSSDQDINTLVVHQQDIQAVVNAMWAAGAEAVTIEGQRVVTTTGIQCAGSTVQVNGLYFPQPYEITAIGDVDAIEQRITDDGYLQVYRAQAAEPDIAIGWDMHSGYGLVAPPYTGPIRAEYAKPVS
ncbi:DUF881 domain-containing protein [Nocardioides jiangxiensis]|uniref:DUF881 domain-containing protein n=1 Tax=Nocardioides jiangxiensis TaxID=3064524 RepID=A0ABT9B1U9_9ACTN|nr:DUF881 domain-containing protein [Nocardioides sp. WY-20]MDO7868274.1 DUF881 domain-containing protein [Nocardioides sp. WY-20]